MSRAEAAAPAAPTIGGALRAALTDFYYNSWRLVPANMLWGVGLVLLYLVALVWPLAALALAPLLAVPTAGVFRLAALIVRGEAASFRDGLAAWRALATPAVAAGIVGVVAAVVFGSNVVTGILSHEMLGWAFATFAAWALATAWVVGLAFWPLLADPARDREPASHRARLAGLLVAAFPARLGALGAVLALVSILSAIAFAALVTVSVSYVALVACRYVLPAADRLEARLAGRATGTR